MPAISFSEEFIHVTRQAAGQKQPPEVFCKEGVFKNFLKFTGKHKCQSLFFNKITVWWSSSFIKKETLLQVFSYKFCKILRRSF